MIFAFDFPKKKNKDGSYDNWPEIFNGLIGLPESTDPYFGPAPPSLIDLLSKFNASTHSPYQILSSDEAISSIKPFYYVLETQGPPGGWLGTEDGYVNTLLSGVSDEILEATRDRQCTIILWSANEGYDPFQYKIFDGIYNQIENNGIPLENFIFISGNLIIGTLHRTWGSINNRNRLIKCIPFNNELYDNYEIMQPNVIFDEDSKDRDKYFLLLNRAPRIHRRALICYLHSKNLLEDTLTSFPSKELAPYGWENSHLSGFFSDMLHLDRKTKSDALRAWKDLENNHLPLTVDVEEWDTNHYGTSVDWLYSRTFFSVVTESIFEDVSVFLDEKVWKPIYNYHPFIILGCPDSLKKLRELGFKTFHPFIDEAYDEEVNPGKRMSMIVNEIERLCSMNFDELKDWYKNLIPILKYNKSFLKEDKYHFDNLIKRIG